MEGQVGQHQCVICQEVIEDGSESRSLPCDHTFHESCVNRWLGEKSTCPICRGEVGGEVGQELGDEHGDEVGEEHEEHKGRGALPEMDLIHQANGNRNRRFIARFRTSQEPPLLLSTQDVDRITAFDTHYSDPSESQDVAATRLRLIIRNFHATPHELKRIIILEGQRLLDMAARSAAESLLSPVH